MDFYDTFDRVSNRLDIPSNIRRETRGIVERSVESGDYTREALKDQIHELQYSLEVKPLSYVDEQKFYTCADGAFKIYEQLSLDKKLRSSAWCMANIAMFSWYFKSLLGYTLTGRDVERAVDEALRSPTYFMIKNCLLGTLQAALMIVPAYVGFSYLGLEEPQRHFISFYIISLLIDFIKVYRRIKKNEIHAIEPIKSFAAK